MPEREEKEIKLDVKDFNPKFKSKSINLITFNKKEVKEQINTIKDILDEIYNGTLKVTNKQVHKCIDLTCDPKDNVVYLPYGLMVEKRDDLIIFKFRKKMSSKLIITLIILFLFAMLGATYSAVNYMSKASLNMDIDGDGIPDINIDVDGDGVADINIDTDGDKKPDLNIDYKGNLKAVFNIDVKGDGTSKTNIVNRDLDGDGVCDLNCDLNKDGWPDINIDVDGDGIADLDIDTNNDKKADLNLDLNGDMKCDLYCDTDGDGKCDLYCSTTKNQENEKEQKNIKKQNDTIIEEIELKNTGDPNLDTATPKLVVVFEESNTVVANEVYPDDQDGIVSAISDKIFTLENTSTIPITYQIGWEVIKNTFTSDNFKYKVESTNGGATLPYTIAPKSTSMFASNVTIPSLTTQKYTISFKLQGLGIPQNYDQNRNFTARIQISIVE